MNTDVILKRISISTTITIVALIVATLILIFYRPVPDKSITLQKNQALEDLRQAQMNLVSAKLDSIRYSQQKLNDVSLRKDIELSQKLDENTKALKENRNEKVRDYTNYDSHELQSAVSILVRQYQAAKLSD